MFTLNHRLLFLVLRYHVIYLSHSAHGKCPAYLGSRYQRACLHLWAVPMLRMRDNPDSCVHKQCAFTCNVLRRISSPLELGVAMAGLDWAEEQKEEVETKEKLE